MGDPKGQGENPCGAPKYKGDKNCDDENNNAGCNYDDGDCCKKTLGKDVVKKYCKICKCLDPKGQGENPCGAPKYKGDKNCDDENNNAGCNYDGGDCCKKTLGKDVVKTYCKICKCLDPKGQGENPCGAPKYKGDKNCDDENNNAGCNYDDGGCCKKTLGKDV